MNLCIINFDNTTNDVSNSEHVSFVKINEFNAVVFGKNHTDGSRDIDVNIIDLVSIEKQVLVVA